MPHVELINDDSYIKEVAFWLGVATLLLFSVLLVVRLVIFVHESLKSSWLKSYWIEDCGDVVKLHGEVSADRSSVAVNELLNTKPGLVLANNSFERYGCTYAAVPAASFYPLQVQVRRTDVVLKSPKMTGYHEIVIGNSNPNNGNKS